MRRQILGILAACFTAPYLTAFLLFTIDTILHGEFDITRAGASLLMLPFLAIHDASVSLIFLSPFSLFFASLLAFILRALNLRSRWIILTVSFLVGAYVMGALFSSSPQGKRMMLIGGLSGAICGWIYWRIAITGPETLRTP